MNVNYRRSLPVRYEPDILIAGGGPAGCAAAWAAARRGADVLLVEGSAALGGMGTNALIPLFLGFSDGEHFLVGDFGRELLDRMHRIGRVYYSGRDSMVIHAESLKRAYDEMMSEAGVKLLLTTRMTDVRCENGHVQYAVLSGKSGIYAARAAMYIDASGDGDLCVWAGARYDKGDENHGLMGGTLCSAWEGVNWTEKSGPDNRFVDQAYADGILDNPDYHLPGLFQLDDVITIGNTGHVFGLDGSDDASLSAGNVRGRELIRRYEEYYRRYVPGCENASVLVTGSMLGVRETRIIRCREKLTLRDFLDRTCFPNEIGRFAYQVDIHASNTSREKYELYLDEYTRYQYRSGESYGIPLGILQPLGLDNVFVAGRCVGTDRHMQSSLRVMPGCMLTGQAAGIAASYCAAHTISSLEVPYAPVRTALEELHVYLPEN